MRRRSDSKKTKNGVTSRRVDYIIYLYRYYDALLDGNFQGGADEYRESYAKRGKEHSMKHVRGWAAAAVLVLLLAQLLTVPAGAAKLVAITFDDGPNQTWTPQVVEALNQRGVKGTFFMVGSWVATKEDLVRSMAEQGHQIANHTWEHLNLTGLDAGEVRLQAERSRERLAEVTGQENFWVRTPFGVRTQTVLNNIDSPLILWNQDPAAGKQVPGEKMARSVIRNIKDGDIILLHDSTQDNLDAACRIIDALQPRGYDFVTVEELFRLRGVTPQNGVIYKSVPPAADPQAYDENRLESHWAWPAISLMEDTGIMTGDEEGWHPNRRLTRAAAAVVLWRAAGEPRARRRADFLDVPKSAWYAEAVAWAEEAGVIKGTGAGRFSPAAPVTRQQLYVMVDRLLDRGSVSVGTGEVRSFEDSFRISGWAREAVERIEALGFISRNDRELFRPQDPATRAEAAELVAWYLGVR